MMVFCAERMTMTGSEFAGIHVPKSIDSSPIGCIESKRSARGMQSLMCAPGARNASPHTEAMHAETCDLGMASKIAFIFLTPLIFSKLV